MQRQGPFSTFLAIGVSAWVMVCLPAAAGDAVPSPSPSPSLASIPLQNPGEYIVRAGDLLHISVWKEPELTREVRVRPDGKLTIPLIGEVSADGQSPEALSVRISEQLRKFLNGPRVTVGVVEASTLRFFVMGRVAKPGEYPLHARTTVLQGLALAGGLAEYAKADDILVIRRQPNADAATPPKSAETVVPFNLKRLVGGRDVSRNFLLQPGDTIVVP